MASGDTKTEAMLNVLGNGGSGDEFRGCCNTKTQQYILDAIDRVQNVEDEVEELKNNPDVVDIVDTYADLQAYDTQHLTDNDIIRVLQDETHSGNSTYYRFTKNPDTWTFIGEISGGGGGDTVYSTKTTSNSNTGGAVYIGNLGTDQTEVADPSPNDNHYKYFWALPSSNNGATYGQPGDGTVNIMGSAKGAGSVTIGRGAGSGSYGAITMVAIGDGANSGNDGVAIGSGSGTSQDFTGNVCIGAGATITEFGVTNSIALGRYSKASRAGELNIGTGIAHPDEGFNSSAYRVIGGVYDGQGLHDAATVAQGNTLAASAPTASTVGVLGQLYTNTTDGKIYHCTAIDTTDPNNPSYTWSEVGAGGGGSNGVELTQADYNYDSDGDDVNDCVALWLLDPGYYYVNNPSVSDPSTVIVRRTRYDSYGYYNYNAFLLYPATQNNNTIGICTFYSSQNPMNFVDVDKTSGYASSQEHNFVTGPQLQEEFYYPVTSNNYNWPENSPDGYALWWRSAYVQDLGTPAFNIRFDEPVKVYFNSTDYLNNVTGFSTYSPYNTGMGYEPYYQFVDITNGDIYIAKTQNDGTKISLKKISGTSI